MRVPKGVTRPSTDRLREALFSIMAPVVPGATVLDLFAGSGALGIEALSRGARHCTFVEKHRAACGTIAANLEKTGLRNAKILAMDVFTALGKLGSAFDLVLADPPYAVTAGKDLAAGLLSDGRLPALVKAEGKLVLETESVRAPPAGEAWDLAGRREYGGSAILIYALRRGA